MNEARIPSLLRDAISRDLEPVRPLASPALRALALLPVGVLLLVAFPAFWSWQHHVARLPSPAWVLSAVETLLSLLVLGACFREAVPGRSLSTRAIACVLGVSGLVFVWVNLTTRSPAGVSEALLLQWFGECITTALTYSIPALIAPAWLVSRALPGRPALTGALCGLGTGLMADAGMRIICRDGDYVHVLVAHGGAILILVALGALSACAIEVIKARRLRRVRAGGVS
ncbi:MAG TPA: NrsF family protein [Steroidobacteraceae bacterium]|nr:NrsF family protein [Steroidobacteraceae bacterium]